MLVITTPTGQIGGKLLARVLDSGQPLRVIARDPGKLSAEVRERVEVVQGSQADPEVVEKALAGADTVFWLMPPDPRAASIQDHTMDLLRPLCAALNGGGVRRVIGVSSIGRATGRHAGQISAAFGADALIESTGVHYRALGMPGFMENLLRQVTPIREHGVFVGTLSADRPVPTCATRDIAAVAAGLLLDDSWTGQEYVPVLGPENLSHHDMARIMSEVLGRPVRYRRISGEEQRAALVGHGMAESSARGIVDMSDAVEAGLYDAELDTPRTNSPTTFRRWCEEELRPAVLGRAS